MTRLKFTMAGLGFALTCELFYRLFARFQPHLIIVAALFYIVYLQGLYALNRRISNPTAFAIASGLTGLFFLEWGLIGNTPWGHPNASQLGMLTIHSAYPVAARIFSEREEKSLQNRILRYWCGFSLVTLCGVLIPHSFLRFAWFIYAPVLGYAGLLVVAAPYLSSKFNSWNWRMWPYLPFDK